MSQPIVYDASALVELFNAHPTPLRLWKQAEGRGRTVVFPAGAIAEANRSLRASYNAWMIVLWPDATSVAPLDVSSAVEAGLHDRHDIATSHVTHEALQTAGVVLTAAPSKYAGAAVQVLIV